MDAEPFDNRLNDTVDRRDETTIEAFYKVRLKSWLSVQPDVQYVTNPSGARDDNAVAATVQLLMDF